jgi:hypothetical protein
MKYIAYAIPLLLSLGVILAGAAGWRAAAGKIAVVVGALALVASGLAVWQVDQALTDLMEAIESLEGLEQGLDDLLP